MRFYVKIHHHCYGVLPVKGFASRDDAYAAYVAAINDLGGFHDCVTMYFGPNGFVLNQWRKPV